MAYPTLYPPQANSPETTLTAAITATATSIAVQDGAKLPAVPNYLVLGGASEAAETVLMTAKSGNTLTAQRGVQGTAQAWAVGTAVARTFTAADHAALQEWAQALKTDTIPLAQKTAANGVASLDASAKIPVAQLPAGTTSAAGAVQLNSTVTSTSTTQAATASAVKTAYDLASTANAAAAAAQGSASGATTAANVAQAAASAATTTANEALAIASEKDWSKSAQSTLTVAGWNGLGQQALYYDEITGNANGDLYIAQTADAAQYAAFIAAQLQVTGQEAGSILVTARGTIPAIDLPIEMEVRT